MIISNIVDMPEKIILLVVGERTRKVGDICEEHSAMPTVDIIYIDTTCKLQPVILYAKLT
jgi:hypothetical protein